MHRISSVIALPIMIGLIAGMTPAAVSASRGGITTRLNASAILAASQYENSGGGPDVPLSITEYEYICTMQKSIPEDAHDSIVEWIAPRMSELMHRNAAIVTSALKDLTFCAKPSAVATVKKAKAIVHLTKEGIVTTTNPVWNACVRGTGITRDLIQSNSDTYAHRQGPVRKIFAKTCRDYHRGDISMWMHPDYPGLELHLDTKGRLLGGVPSGYTLVREGSSSVVKK